MKKTGFIYCLIGLFFLAGCTIAPKEKDPVDYVDPNIGGIGQIGHGLSSIPPTVSMPYGMMSISPSTTPGFVDRYLADKIYGFPAGSISFMPMSGKVETVPAKYASMRDQDITIVTPYYSSIILEKYDIQVEFTVTSHAAHYRLTFPKDAPASILFNLPQNTVIDPSNTVISGGSRGSGRGRGSFFYAEFSKPVTSFEKVASVESNQRAMTNETNQRMIAAFTPDQDGRVEIRVSLSGISLEQAQQNLQKQIPGWNFEKTKEQGRKVWNDALRYIEIKGGTEEQRTIFYTALYRVYMSVSNTVEEGGQFYGSFDQKIHDANGRGFYPIGAGAAMWGNYRSLEPLHLLLDPQQQIDLINSFIIMQESVGTMKAINRGLSGHHIIGVALDAYMKGYRDFDVEKAYAGFKQLQMNETFLPWRNVPQTPLDRFYIENGYFPALKVGEKETEPGVHPWERRQAVGVTLEATYDDWCMAEWARVLNKKEDFEYFKKRARNYENVFDKRIGFMAPKSADGEWVLSEKEFSPVWSGGQGGREYYTEMNGWTYTFHVQQDVAGLINLMGGREKFIDKLNALFQATLDPFEPPEPFRGNGLHMFRAMMPDQTGLIGQYGQGNEPSFHIPYLYNYAGQPWMTQRRVRDIMKVWYNAGPIGYCGDEDNGEMTSWYVMSAMGFFTVCPGRPVYDIGSPIFDEVKLKLEGGKIFTITAKNVSKANKYIQSAMLNGKPLNKPWFEHKDIVNGGSLVLDMGPRPNYKWGSSPEAAPPSSDY